MVSGFDWGKTSCDNALLSALSSSMALHPNFSYVATGQVAGHDKQEGKVLERLMIQLGCAVVRCNKFLFLDKTSYLICSY